MKSTKSSITLGVVLIAAGVLLLLDVLGVVNGASLIWPVIFGAAGVSFLALFFRSRDNWWAAIPGFVFAGLAVVTAWGILLPTSAQGWGGSLFFLFLGGGFMAVYLRERGNWWALIPAGVLWTLAVVTAIPADSGGMVVPAVLFLGIAATFAALTAVPVRTGKGPDGHIITHMKWPLFPAVILGVMGLLFAVQATALLSGLNLVVPVVLVLGGAYLVVFSLRNRRPGEIRKTHRGGHLPLDGHTG